MKVTTMALILGLGLAFQSGCTKNQPATEKATPEPTYESNGTQYHPDAEQENKATSPDEQTDIVVTVSPSNVSLAAGGTQQFTASTAGANNQGVTWTAATGSITSGGLYTASGQNDTVTATHSYYKGKKGTASVTGIADTTPAAYTARTDTGITQLPTTMPKWGETGIGQKWCNPAYHGICIIRVTDSSIVPSTKVSFVTSDTGTTNLWAVDSRHLLVKAEGGRFFVMSFDPTSEAVAVTSLAFNYDGLVFSRTDPNVLYGLNGTVVTKITAAKDWATATTSQLFDFKQCLGQDFKLTWNGTWSLPFGDNMFADSFSNTGPQGSGNWVAAYAPGKGCRLWNTLTGEITGDWGAVGQIDDGSTNCDGAACPVADRFVMHGTGTPQDPNYLLADYSVNDGTPGHKGQSGCKAGNCGTDGPYIWEIATTHVRLCGNYNCDGHSAKGYKYIATGKQYKLHEFANPSKPLTSLIIFPPGFPDQHGTWQNTDTSDSPPACMVTTDTTPVYPYPTWGYDEVLCLASDGSKKVFRFGQTLNSGKHPLFITANAIGTISQDGRWMEFASDMCGKTCPSPPPLGFNNKNVVRGDVFIMELK